MKVKDVEPKAGERWCCPASPSSYFLLGCKPNGQNATGRCPQSAWPENVSGNKLKVRNMVDFICGLASTLSHLSAIQVYNPEACTCLRITTTQVKSLTAHKHPAMPSRGKEILPTGRKGAEKRYWECLSAWNCVIFLHSQTQAVPWWF